MDMNRMATWDVAAFSDEGSLEALKAIILNCVFGHATKDYAQASSRLHRYVPIELSTEQHVHNV